ncbi:MAG: hypothetical protein JW983_04755 [Elusimicrobia bacterium]|nr:hypothetical protein [Elusimicrobiota bacterium]
MKKITAVFTLLLFYILVHYKVSYAQLEGRPFGVYPSSSKHTDLEGYNIPVEISVLEWELLKIQVLHFSKISKWDEFDLITSVELSSTKSRPTKILLTFTVNNNQYVKLKSDISKKVFINAIETMCKTIKIFIPEVDSKLNVTAIFSTAAFNGKILARYDDGKIYLEN